jgi:hypothetical protein
MGGSVPFQDGVWTVWPLAPNQFRPTDARLTRSMARSLLRVDASGQRSWVAEGVSDIESGTAIRGEQPLRPRLEADVPELRHTRDLVPRLSLRQSWHLQSRRRESPQPRRTGRGCARTELRAVLSHRVRELSAKEPSRDSWGRAKRKFFRIHCGLVLTHNDVTDRQAGAAGLRGTWRVAFGFPMVYGRHAAAVVPSIAVS